MTAPDPSATARVESRPHVRDRSYLLDLAMGAVTLVVALFLNLLR